MADLLKVLIDCSGSIMDEVRSLYGSVEGARELALGAGGDMTKVIDKVAEDVLIESLLSHGLTFTLISEETGLRSFGDEPTSMYVVADPLDGSMNASRGIPFAATSIAVSRRPNLRDVELAVVRDLIKGTAYTARRGEGSRKDGVPIEPSKMDRLEESVVGVDLGLVEDEGRLLRMVPILGKVKHIRHLGANALELCYVADGTMDAFIELRRKLRVLDLAAAYLILSEAGVTVTTPEGAPLEAPLTAMERVSFIAASNKALHKLILDELEPHRSSR